MIYFPPEYVKTDYQGYLWNMIERRLYTIKTTGVLRPMTFHKGGVPYGREGKVTVAGYQISDKGVRKTLTLKYLHSLTYSGAQWY